MSIVLKLPHYSDIPDHIPSDEIPYYRDFMSALLATHEKVKEEEAYGRFDNIACGTKAYLRILDIEEVMMEYMEQVCLRNWDEQFPNIKEEYLKKSEEEREEMWDDFRADFFCDTGYWYQRWFEEMIEAAYDYRYCFLNIIEDPDIMIMNSPQICVYHLTEDDTIYQNNEERNL